MNKKIYIATYTNLDVEDGKIDHSEVKVFDSPADAAKWLEEDLKDILDEINAWEDERPDRPRHYVDSWHDGVRGYINFGYSETDLTQQHLWKVTEAENPLFKELDGLATRVCEWKDAMDKAEDDKSSDAVLAEDNAFCRVREAVREVKGDESIWD